MGRPLLFYYWPPHEVNKTLGLGTAGAGLRVAFPACPIDDVQVSEVLVEAACLPWRHVHVVVVAGGLDLDYDEILQLRVAISEAFEMVTRQIGSNEAIDDSSEIATVFVIRPDRLEVLVRDPGYRQGATEDSKEKESRVVHESLADAVEIGAEERGHRVIKLVKRRSAEEV